MKSGSFNRPASGASIDEAEGAFDILGLPRDASSAEVRAAYIRLVKEFHPDTNPGDHAAERRFKRITKAYNELRSPYPALRAAQTYRPQQFWAAHGQVLAIAVMFLVLTPLAIVLATRNEERSAPSLEFKRAEAATPAAPGDDGGRALVKETAVEHGLAPSAPQELIVSLKTDEFAQNRPAYQDNGETAERGLSSAPLSEEHGKDGRFRRSAYYEARASQGVDETNLGADASPQGRALIPNRQNASTDHEDAVAPAEDKLPIREQIERKKVASLQRGMQEKRERGVEPVAPPQRSNAVVEKPGNKFILPSKTVATDAVIVASGKQKLKPERVSLTARAALLEQSLDRTMLTAAPGG